LPDQSGPDDPNGMYTPYGNGALGGITTLCGTDALPVTGPNLSAAP
jgi:hypothetical protein